MVDPVFSCALLVSGLADFGKELNNNNKKPSQWNEVTHHQQQALFQTNSLRDFPSATPFLTELAIQRATLRDTKGFWHTNLSFKSFLCHTETRSTFETSSQFQKGLAAHRLRNCQLAYFRSVAERVLCMKKIPCSALSISSSRSQPVLGETFLCPRT